MKNLNSKTIILTGGGTAGHCMPNFYLLPELKKHFDKIIYIGSKNGLEKDICEKHGVEYHAIDTCKLVRGKIWRNLKIPFVLAKSISQCKRLIKELKPDVIFSKGGFVALPVCVAGKKLKVPVVSHESDFSFGLANKLILKTCSNMCVNYPNLASLGDKIEYTGPILPATFGQRTNISTPLSLDSDKKTLLFLGGSQGSVFLNEHIYNSARELEKKYNIIHICGKNNAKNYKSFGNYNVLEFSNEMSALYSRCDLVIGRAGAGVIFESLYSNKPLLLIPLENKSSRGDQVQNSQYFKTRGVVEMIRQNELSSALLIDNINKMINNIEHYKQNIKKLSLPNGRDKAIQIILKCAK